MSVDAGSINSEVRIKLSQLNADIQACKTAFDNLGEEFGREAEKYSTGAGSKYQNALKNIAKETKNVESAAKAGALSEQEAVQRLIEIRQRELRVLQEKAVKEGTASAETVKAINKTKDALTALEEKEKLLSADGKTGKGFLDTFAAMRDTMLGPVAIAREVINIFQRIGAATSALEDEYLVNKSATAQLGAVLKSTGATAWTTNEHLAEVASTIQKLTGVEDDEITSMQTVLLGFRNIQGVNFDKATKSIVDMASVMGGGGTPNASSLIAAAQAVGKALDNPIEGMDALSRQGFKFAEQEKEMIAQLVKSGELEKAQGIILDELSKTFGGAAEAAATMKDKVEVANKELQEEAGRAIANNGFLEILRQGWIKIAGATKEALDKQNDYQELLNRSSKGTATAADKLTLLRMELAKLKEDLAGAEVTGGYWEGSAEGIKNNIVATEALIKATEDQQKAEKAAADAKTKDDAAAAAAAKKKADADARQAEITKERSQAETEYGKTVSDINRLWGSGAITFDEAAKQKQAAYKTEMDALTKIVEKYGLTEGATVELRDSVTRAYVAITEAINRSEKAVKDEAETQAKETQNIADGEALRAKLRDQASKARDDSEKAIASETKSIDDQIKALEDEGKAAKAASKTQFDALIEAAEAAGVNTEAIQTLKDKWDELQGKIKEKKALEDFKKNTLTVLDSLGSAFDSIVNSMTEAFTASIDKQIDALDDQIEALQDSLDTELTALEEESEAKQNLIEYDGKTYEQYLKDKIAAAQAEGDEEEAAELEKTLAKYNIQQEYAKKEQELKDQEAAAEEALTKKKEQLQYEADYAEWKAKLLTAAADAALAIIKNYATLDPITATVMAAITAGVTAAQINAINEAKPIAPSAATGGIVLPTSSTGTLVNVAENKHAELLLNNSQAGQPVMQEFADAIVAAMGKNGTQGGDIVINLSNILDGQVVAESTARRIRNGNVSIKR